MPVEFGTDLVLRSADMKDCRWDDIGASMKSLTHTRKNDGAPNAKRQITVT
jgi:hypothetical protein